MANSIGIMKIYPDSFRANVYSVKPFRMIGLIDVGIVYKKSIERVTLPFFRSSGTNSGKIEGLWYPIVGIKLTNGGFTEFSPYLNYILSEVTKNEKAHKGWLAKSLFFDGMKHNNNSKVRGFSKSRHNESLYWVGRCLRELYEDDKYTKMTSLNSQRLNEIVMSKEKYDGNKNTQLKNFESIIEDIFKHE